MNNKRTLVLSFFLLLAAIPIFYNLAGPAIYIFDEAIYANNALEMAIDGDPLVLKNNGEVSLYNTKPPFVIWMQSISIKIFGANEWAIRLPSALAAFGTVFLLLIFAHRSLRDYRIGLVAMLVLVTSPGYIRNHVARSGDLDAMLVFWITFYTLLAFDYLLHRENKNYRKHFFWIGFGVVLAFLSKSVAGLMPLLGLTLAAAVQKQLVATLKKPFLYLVAFSAAGICLGYYGLREYLAPGYLDQVLFSEYSRFTNNIMPWHKKPFGFYLDNMWNEGYFMPYLPLLPLAVLLAFRQKDNWREAALMLLVFCTSFFLLISFPEVKLNYYDAPLYPFFSLLIGIGALRLWNMFGQKIGESRGGEVYFYLALVLLFFLPFKNIWTSIQDNTPFSEYEKEGLAIRTLKQELPEAKDYKILMNSKYKELLDQAYFYIKSANYQDAANLELVTDWKALQKGDKVLCCQPLRNSLRTRFVLETEWELDACFYFYLK